MARMSIDDSIGREPRLDHLALLCGWTRRETLGCLQLDIWPLCYDRVTPNIPRGDLERAAGRSAVAPVVHPGGFVGALIESAMGRPATKKDRQYELVTKSGIVVVTWPDQEIRDRVYVCGAAERIAYIIRKKSSAQLGGIKSAESRANGSKHQFNASSSTGSTDAQAHGNPTPTPTPSPSALPSASVKDPEKNSAPPTAGGLLSVQEQPPERKRKPSEPTAAESAAVQTVLSKLSAQNGVRYSGTAEHTRLIVGHLRSGVAEIDLRAVIGYCALELGWAANPDMAKYLRPETLFGPRTIAKYLDPARTWFSKLGDDT